jgi:hypothetical protein
MKWQELHELLPDRHRRGFGWEPPVPLILGGWWYSNDREKRDRLELHLRWAADHGVLLSITNFLNSLKEEDWHHEDQ